VWSALEYAAHSRDVTALHLFGVQQALEQEEPAFPEIDEGLVDSLAATYETADPVEVGGELADHAERLAAAVGRSGPEVWTRGLIIGSVRRDVRRMVEHALHDSLHHLGDVERGLDALGPHRP
jgi:hypothetical protein